MKETSMRNKIIAILMPLCITATAQASSRSVTFYADAAVFEIEGVATKGTVEIYLPPDMIEGSLRIKPTGSAVIQKVDILSAKGDGGKKEKEREALLEQKNRVQDRLKALETREQIFTAAAKSQSGKAPRKSKTNPDPMQSIRQGTDFAIAQLEAVYTARRKAELELKRLDVRIVDANRSENFGGSVAKVVLGGQRGSVMARYMIKNRGWSPRYDFRIDNNPSVAKVDLSVTTAEGFNGYKQFVTLSKRSDDVKPVPVAHGSGLTTVARFSLPVSELFFGNAGESHFSFVVNNREKQYLPSGVATVYRSGEYMGKARFDGLSSGRSRRITEGNIN